MEPEIIWIWTQTIFNLMCYIFVMRMS